MLLVSNSKSILTYHPIFKNPGDATTYRFDNLRSRVKYFGEPGYWRGETELHADGHPYNAHDYAVSNDAPLVVNFTGNFRAHNQDNQQYFDKSTIHYKKKLNLELYKCN